MQNNFEEILNEAKELLKSETTSISYQTWIQPLKIKNILDNTIVLIAEDDFKRDAILSRYQDLIANTFSYILQKKCILKIITEDNSLEDEIKYAKNTIDNSYGYSNSFLNPKYT